MQNSVKVVWMYFLDNIEAVKEQLWQVAAVLKNLSSLVKIELLQHLLKHLKIMYFIVLVLNSNWCKKPSRFYFPIFFLIRPC